MSVDTDQDIAHGVTAEDLAKALAEHPDADRFIEALHCLPPWSASARASGPACGCRIPARPGPARLTARDALLSREISVAVLRTTAARSIRELVEALTEQARLIQRRWSDADAELA
ncbi:hypothetical protein [Streptomyces sp. NPDC005262]|uniref:hypothetical protein n=1 Tax=Streptomyces sp. NPDC005262 TaxID=3364710 RepID=UPI0036B264B1